MGQKVIVLLWLGLFSWCCLAGCETLKPFAATCKEPPDSLIPDIFKQAKLDRLSGLPPVAPDLVLRVVPYQTPVAKARAIMEKHGFSCWSRVPDGNNSCLLCTYWKQNTEYAADKITAKLFYDKDVILSEAVMVEFGVVHPERTFLPRFE